ncbi:MULTISPECIES: shikimate kinase [Comamonas]|uniref:shikimate kinase n=1 Tax=Comamonas TaxID=283 RepID=UPI0012C671F7|nr:MULTISPECIES: shikimate kinase [Comamonas]MDR3067426.1 shikimate kinase [Comamonas sp.]MEB5965864.1 shikimate kinase [Comamonas testosteroni]MPS95795.1 shikimate kinase [Comamonas sp.]
MTVQKKFHIALVGLPGCGKSTIGRYLAKRWSMSFVDVDTAIEEHVGCTIREFFAKEGEPRFREVEQQVLAVLLARAEKTVVATGGGAVLKAENRTALAAHAQVVYLSASPHEIAKRLQRDTQRPLLQVDNPLQRLQDLHALRDPLYKEVADFVVAGSGLSAAQVAQRVAMQVELGHHS